MKMKRTRLIIIGIALCSGLLAAYLSSGMREPGPIPVAVAEPIKVAAEEVLVAARDLPLGARISAADVKWIAWPADGEPAGHPGSCNARTSRSPAMTIR